MSSKLSWTLAGAAVLLASCDTIDPVSQSTDPGFGEALAYDKAIQTVNPDPPPPTPGASEPGGNGEKGTAAVTRYRKDAVKEVERQGTKAASSGSK